MSSNIPLRDFLAATISNSDFALNGDVELRIELVGRPFPSGAVEQIEWALELEAKIRYMRADAMIRVSRSRLTD